MLTCSAVAVGAGDSPIKIELFDQFASFTNCEHPDNRIGYRIREQTPLTPGYIPQRAARSGAGTEGG